MNHNFSFRTLFIGLILSGMSISAWCENVRSNHLPFSRGQAITPDETRFFTARRDFRECIYPLCGGFFVKAVNTRTTLCPNGRRQFECYVSDIRFPEDINNPPTSAYNNSPIFLEGNFSPETNSIYPEIGTFDATTVHYSVTDQMAFGYFFSVQEQGIVCITSPCFSAEEKTLNQDRSIKLSNINFEESGAAEEDIMRARERLANGETLFVVGYNRKYQGFAGPGLEVVIKQFYLPSDVSNTTTHDENCLTD